MAQTLEKTVQAKTWKDYLPEYVNLYYVDYNDDLSDRKAELQQCVSDNDYCPLWEVIDTCWDSPTEYEMEEIRKKMAADELEDEFEAHVEEIREWLWEHDKSTPLEDLLRNTGDVIWFYSLGEYFYDLWNHRGEYDEEQEDEDVATMCRILGVDANSKQAEQLREIRKNASYGGFLRIYFKAPLSDLISNSDEEDFEAIRFKGKFSVYIHNPNEGAGYSEDIELDKTFSFKRDNLFHMSSDRYDAFETYGIDNSCIADGKVEMLKEVVDNVEEVKPSLHKAQIESEMEFERVFKAGGCSKGDPVMRRHRHLEYQRTYPCGFVCKDCGMFWVD